MKWLWRLAILMLILAGCGGGASPGSGWCDQGLCVKIEVVEPVQWGKPLTVKITVTTEADIPDLGVSIYTYPPDVVVEGPIGWEPTSKGGMVWKGGAGWLVATKANQPIVFIRNIRVPAKQSPFLVDIQANASTREGRRVSHSVHIYLAREGGKVYYAGTPLPITPWPLPVYITTLGPSLTPQPTFTPTPTLPLTPTPLYSPLATPTQPLSPFGSPISTPAPAAYP
jgi:hypothetical protein